MFFTSPKERLEGARVILIVPGNPGLASFYEVPSVFFFLFKSYIFVEILQQSFVQEFMLVLQREISEEPLSIWAVSHIGACSNPIVKSCRSV